MDDDRKPLWPWIVALLIGLPVLYVALFGPACWLCENRGLDQRSAWIAFRSCTWLCVHGPKPLRTSLRWYARAFGDQTRLGFAPGGKVSGSMCLSFLDFVRLDGSVSPIDYEETCRKALR